MLRLSLFRGLSLGQSCLPMSNTPGEQLNRQSLKKPPSGFLLFLNEMRPSSAGMPLTDLAKSAGEKWRQLSEESREVYNQNSKMQLEAWKGKLAKINEDPIFREAIEEMKATAKLKRGKRALKKAIHAKQQLEEETKKPRRFLTPYGFYLKENFGKVQKLRPDDKQTLAQMSESWKTLSEEAKAKYIEMGRISKMDYDVAITKWKEEINSSGKAKDLEILAEKVRSVKRKSKRSSEQTDGV